MGERKIKRGNVRNMERHIWEMDTVEMDVDT